MKRTHLLNLGGRIFEIVIHERADTIEIDLPDVRIIIPGDWFTLAEWMKPIFEEYDSDPRPCLLRHLDTGKEEILGDGRASSSKA